MKLINGMTLLSLLLLLSACGKSSSSDSEIVSAYKNSESKLEIKQADKQIEIKSDKELLDGLVLNDDERGCYILDESKELKNIHVCQTPAIVSIYAESKTDEQPVKFVFKRDLSADSKPAEGNRTGVQLETPKIYSMNDLIKITKEKSFTNRLALDQLKMTKTSMRLHYLNLLPHLSMNSAIALATFSGPLSILGSIGDLVPFLLPNRWIQAKESEHLYKAEVFGSKIAEEDSVQLVEGLALSVARDQKLFDQYVAYRSEFMDNIKFLKGLEKDGKIPAGRYRDLESPLALFDQMISSLADIIESEQGELAFAMGLKNPDAIKGVDVGNLIESTAVEKREVDERTVDKVISSSQEMGQLDEMIKAASLDKKDKFFEWLDPAGDPQSGIGLGLPASIALAKENVKFFNDTKEQLKATLVQKIISAQKDLGSSYETHKQSVYGITLQEKRIKTAIDEMVTNPNDTPIGELQDALNQLAVQKANELTSKFLYITTKSRMNRLTHEGIYQVK